MFIKKVTVTVLAFIMLLGTTTQTTYAQHAFSEVSPEHVQNDVFRLSGAEIVKPLWVNARYVSPGIGVSGRTVSAYITITATASSEISGNLFIERFNGRYWEIAGRWYVSGRSSLSASRSTTVASGSRCRTRFNGYVGSDWINVTSNEAYVW